MTESTSTKLSNLRQKLQEMQKVLIAYSGGVDSTFLLAFSQETLGKQVTAITITTPLIPPEEIINAKQITKDLDILHKIVPINILKLPAIKSNKNNRCYLCKKHIFAEIQHLAKKHNNTEIVEGSTADDTTTYRPGIQALIELKIRSPLIEVGLIKQEIRSISKKMGLPTWNKPASPCLATRFPYNTTITTKKIKQVERAEQYLKSLGFPIVRVRHHGDIARIEVTKTDLPKIITQSEKIHQEFKKIGYNFTTIDLNGYQSGCYDGEN